MLPIKISAICLVLIFCYLNSAYGNQRSLQADRLYDRFYDDVRQVIKLKRKLSDDILNPEIYLKRVNTPHPTVDPEWPTTNQAFGQITAIAISPDGYLSIFHRGNREWNERTFNRSHYYQLKYEGPIDVNTVLLIRPHDGVIDHGWGRNFFYMPHGMTIDIHGNYWMTDVALHQVFKFKPFNNTPIITLGKRFQPGTSSNHFCKPTAVAVATTGEVFVADGYCNSRIMKYNALGQLLRTIPQPPEFMSLQVPHGITLLEHLDLLCIADRENMRVVCPRAGLKTSIGEGQPAATIQEPDLGRVFDVAAFGDIVFAVNGPTSIVTPVRGVTIDPKTETVIDHWGEFTNPHCIAYNPVSNAVYVGEIGPNKLWKFTLN